ncbi:MAG: PIG-L family deacetylase [Verrucomicrobia bacterium]|nr:PIG-L family deacetylase [Verrucomicrobiota bacterium]MBV9128815.1 PIG-L family deacetylase [Verrucomicrobiota bacterium]
MFSFSKSDKVLIIAPHPDDESLATGGVLQRIFAQKIPVRIVFATNGENNAWVQRYWDRIWRIGPDEQTQWGRRRRQEALNAICSLGGNPDCASFLHLPDLGITDLLMRGTRDLSILFTEEIQEYEPTLAIIPTIFDAHPDHSALSVAFSMALESAGSSSIQTWEYLVHKPQVPIPRKPVKLLLTAEEVKCKRRAILCHETQVALSRRRFTSFAKVEEAFYRHRPGDLEVDASTRATARLHEGGLSLHFEISLRERFRSEILFAFRSESAEHRWSLPVPLRSGNVQIRDTIRDRGLHEAVVQWNGRNLFIGVPLPCAPDFDALYAKISSWTLFFDRSGWSRLAGSASREKSVIRRAKMPGLATLL